MACDLLAVGAHPDDVEIFCGGTIAKLARRGRRVGILDLTRGEMGTRGSAEERAAEAARAAERLGAAFRETLDFGDGGLRTGRVEELALAAKIRAHRPRLVIAPARDSRHPDHGRAAQLVTDAAFLAGLAKLPIDGQPHRPQRVIYSMEMYLFLPTFVVDVSAEWETKMAAIREFGSQVTENGGGPSTFISRPEFLEMIEARGRFFGGQTGARYAEAFFSQIPPKLEDPVAAYDGIE